jgi:hypothetical protein
LTVNQREREQSPARVAQQIQVERIPQALTGRVEPLKAELDVVDVRIRSHVASVARTGRRGI